MRKRRVFKWIVISAVTMATILGLTAAGLGLYVGHRTTAMRTLPDPFASIPGSERPAPEPALTILLVGVDSRPGDGGRSDVMLLVRMAADRKAAYVISLPRDSWVTIPDRGEDKLNAAYAFGGPTLTVRTVERLTGLHIDHFALINFDGFRELTDAVGGVTVTVPEYTRDPSQGAEFQAGTYRLNGDRALEYVRQRYGLPRGEFDRMRRQQAFLRSLMEQTISEETLSNPTRMLGVLNAVTKVTKVDAGFDLPLMLSLTSSARQTKDNVHFLTVPVQGTGRVGDASVVFLDTQKGPAFWRSVAAGDLEGQLATFQVDVLNQAPR